MSMFEEVVQLTGYNFNEIYNMSIFEFLNYTMYIRHRNKEKAQYIKEQQRKANMHF